FHVTGVQTCALPICVPGGTVSVTLALDRDAEDEAVSAGLDLLFDAETLDFFVPVADSCAVAGRIADTHAIGGRILEPGVLNLEKIGRASCRGRGSLW